MPGKHSPEKLAERRRRAAQFGYLRPRAANVRHLQVPVALADRAKDSVRALELHAELNEAAGAPHHFAAHAALAARSVIGEQKFASAKVTIKRGNTARHDWSPSRASVKAVDADPLAAADPWARSQPASCATGKRECSTQPVGPNGGLLSADAPPFEPPSHAETTPAGRSETSAHEWEVLVRAQNDTIALLLGKLEGTLPGHRRIRLLESKLDTLAGSLASTVESAVDKKLVGAEFVTNSAFEMMATDFMEVVKKMEEQVRDVPPMRSVQALVESVWQKFNERHMALRTQLEDLRDMVEIERAVYVRANAACRSRDPGSSSPWRGASRRTPLGSDTGSGGAACSAAMRPVSSPRRGASRGASSDSDTGSGGAAPCAALMADIRWG